MPLRFEMVPERWPTFTKSQVDALQEIFPARCIKPGESLEDHQRYAGKVELIAQLREHVTDAFSLVLTEDEEDALDAEAADMALHPERHEV